MANGLTGDFDVVLQVSESTLDRLLAAMHQNGFANPDLPSFPHIARFRIGDDNPVGGERGSVVAQIGVPRLVLIDGATDRFGLELGFRARYRADPGSAPLADVIHGTIRALYRIAPIDSNCPGWSGVSGDYLWFRVVRSSVSLDGTEYRTGGVAAAIYDHDLVAAHLNKHLAGLLAGKFEPKPHTIGPLFRRMMSRSGAAGAGVSVPISADGSAVAGGDIASVHQLFLRGHDFAIAIADDYLVRAVQDQVDGFVGDQTDIHYSRDAGVGGGLILDYHFRIDGITTEWLGGALFAPAGIVRITVACSGWASRLYRSGVFNIGHIDINDLRMAGSVEQFLMVQFDAAVPRLRVSALGDPTLTFIGAVNGMVRAASENMIVRQARAMFASKLGDAQARLDDMTFADDKDALVAQLTSVDALATAFFTGAIFEADGIILHGAVRLGERYAPHLEFVQGAPGDHFDAIETWIPGGRVDEYHWTWRWFTNPVEKAPGPAGSRTEPDSFYLERPAKPRSKFGRSIGENPLPGLDGVGEVCLSITGVQVDPVTGALVRVEFGPRCAKFGYQFTVPAQMNGPYVRVCDPLGAVVDGRSPELGRLRSTADPGAPSANTLLVYLDRQWSAAAGTALIGGVGRCRRSDAGLIVVVLFEAGTFDTLDTDAVRGLDDLRGALEAPLLVTEDVDTTWARWLALYSPESPQWRLVDPAGVIAWVGSGLVDERELATVLDDRLVTSAPARVLPAHDVDVIGRRFPVDLGDADADCPPIPLQRPGTVGSRVLFADRGQASTAMIGRLHRTADDDDEPPCVAVVFTGATPAQVRVLRAEHPSSADFIADPTGELTRAAGVSFAPTVYTLDATGRVVDVATTAPRGYRLKARS